MSLQAGRSGEKPENTRTQCDSCSLPLAFTGPLNEEGWCDVCAHHMNGFNALERDLIRMIEPWLLAHIGQYKLVDMTSTLLDIKGSIEFQEMLERVRTKVEDWDARIEGRLLPRLS